MDVDGIYWREQARLLAEAGEELLQWNLAARDAPGGTLEKRVAQQRYDGLHVEFSKMCQVVLKDVPPIQPEDLATRISEMTQSELDAAKAFVQVLLDAEVMVVCEEEKTTYQAYPNPIMASDPLAPAIGGLFDAEAPHMTRTGNAPRHWEH